MPTFPTVRSLVVPPSQWWSLGKTVTLLSNTLYNQRFPTDALTDGSVWPVCKLTYGTGTIRVNTEQTRTPNIFGVLAHNADLGAVFGVTNEAGLSRGFGARDPNCWIDLRGFPTTAQYWDLLFNGLTRGFGVGEIVIATGFEFDGVFDVPYEEQVRYWQERDETEYGKLYIAASGSMTRTCSLRMTLIPDYAEQFAQVCDEAGAAGTRVLVVPDTRRNDIWLAEWPSARAFRYEASYREAKVDLTLIDQSPGVRA
jgi:hypothetical protein